MSMIKDIVKWSIVLCVATVLLYTIFPKYEFSGPNNFPFFRCNTITGEIVAWDYENEKWVAANKESMRLHYRFRIE